MSWAIKKLFTAFFVNDMIIHRQILYIGKKISTHIKLLPFEFFYSKIWISKISKGCKYKTEILHTENSHFCASAFDMRARTNIFQEKFTCKCGITQKLKM